MTGLGPLGKFLVLETDDVDEFSEALVPLVGHARLEGSRNASKFGGRIEHLQFGDIGFFTANITRGSMLISLTFRSTVVAALRYEARVYMRSAGKRSQCRKDTEPLCLLAALGSTTVPIRASQLIGAAKSVNEQTDRIGRLRPKRISLFRALGRRSQSAM